MSQIVENYVERYIKRHHMKMKQICEPLQRFFGINYFTYHSISLDGLWRPFVSRPDWADFFTENQLYLNDPLMLHPRCYQSGTVLWTHYIDDPYLQGILKIGQDKFQMAHGFCIIERTKTGCDFFGFNAPPEHFKIYSTYLEDIAVLRKFCRYFKTEAAPILKLINDDPIPLMDLKGKAFEEIHESPFHLSRISKSLFLKHIQAEPSIKLSKREKECLNCYLDELRMQDVAINLNLSVRTVECYLNNIKNKLNCWNKAELIKKGQELRTLGLIP